MGNENTKEFSTFVTPDSLRKILQLLKNFYAGYTKKNYGYEDINGSQYTGNIHNFGSELLLEARKILMNKPSLKQMFIQNTFDFYFNIQYSGLIDTYDQQSLLVATIEKDVLLSNKKYYIRFDNCDDKFILRSESWSDPIVRRDHFVHTKTPPTLVIKNDSEASQRYKGYLEETLEDSLSILEHNNCCRITISPFMRSIVIGSIFLWRSYQRGGEGCRSH